MEDEAWLASQAKRDAIIQQQAGPWARPRAVEMSPAGMNRPLSPAAVCRWITSSSDKDKCRTKKPGLRRTKQKR